MLTVVGHVRLNRPHVRCVGCGESSFPADARLGLEGSASVGAVRLMCRAATARSFRAAAEDLKEFCGLSVSVNTVRAVAQGEGRRLGAAPVDPSAGAAFARAAGDVELEADGTMVNTLSGWRELRLAALTRRPRGPSATPAQWDRRTLPAPSFRLAFGGIWSADRFGSSWRRTAGRLGVADPTAVTVLADGAKWIWKQAAVKLPGAAGVLDVFHACQHLFECADRIFGEGSADGRRWARARRRTLLKAGAAGLCAQLRSELPAARSKRRRTALTQLAAYLTPHAERTDYRRRLAQGRSIGSGLIEGTCKTMGKRLKQTGARWRVRNVDAMTALCCLACGGRWTDYWSARAG